MSLWSARELPWWPEYLYAAYFASYLAGLDAAGPLAGMLLGSATAAAVMITRRAPSDPGLRILLSAIVVAAAVVMTGLRDTHGVGLLAGLVFGLALSANRAGRPDLSGGPG